MGVRVLLRCAGISVLFSLFLKVGVVGASMTVGAGHSSQQQFLGNISSGRFQF